MPFIFQFPATSGRTSGVMPAFHNLLMPWAISKACSKEKHHALDVRGIYAIPSIFLPNIIRSSTARPFRHVKVAF
ncbi:hypothetical protein PO860_09370 [Rhizobium sp. BJ04]|uniref:hypothetical protein n=1 Tax=Rhizobium binxianense TaxID=3024242 RepID=UPI0023A9909F|nr:hypothetical protein [Rhizobium sp. BJ04]WEA62612.1 hypothetical protein PO860_09370 [Rhizobium sp. BJ04]